MKGRRLRERERGKRGWRWGKEEGEKGRVLHNEATKSDMWAGEGCWARSGRLLRPWIRSYLSLCNCEIDRKPGLARPSGCARMAQLHDGSDCRQRDHGMERVAGGLEVHLPPLLVSLRA